MFRKIWIVRFWALLLVSAILSLTLHGFWFAMFGTLLMAHRCCCGCATCQDGFSGDMQLTIAGYADAGAQTHLCGTAFNGTHILAYNYPASCFTSCGCQWGLEGSLQNIDATCFTKEFQIVMNHVKESRECSLNFRHFSSL